ncbi:MAG: SGNH/GDSL hydrolase family protein [Pedobacter sp.]|nr:MAG: SGNH/GDSL hydrolase family protein [Pedobacter sp.]
MKILFIGDSITLGLVGESYVKQIGLENPHWKIKNAGIGGDTLSNISERVINELKQDVDFDVIVFEAGYNDIILPYFNSRGFLFRIAYKFLISKGRNPLSESRAFKAEYKGIVKKMKNITKARIVLMTIGCINENLGSKLNSKRLNFNRIIREIAENSDCLLADIASEFELILYQSKQTDYLLKNFWNSIYFDLKACTTPGGSNQLSSKRNLELTIDGVHLNYKGAEITKNVIEKQIALSKTNLNKP